MGGGDEQEEGRVWRRGEEKQRGEERKSKRKVKGEEEKTKRGSVMERKVKERM